jgi:SAM-dependent methyltransferase
MMTPIWIAAGRRRAGTLVLVLLTGLPGASAPGALATVDRAGVAQDVASGAGVHPISGRRIASVMSHAGADWLDRPEREVEERPDQAIEALRLRPGAVVADLGAGSGYFTVRLARRVGPAGRVFAADIQPEMLSLLRTRVQREALTNVELVQSAENDPRLPARTFDLILMVDVYHELAQPQVILSKLLASLKPAGQLVLLEYRKEDPAVPIRPEHKMSVADARLELEAEGFQLDRVDGSLPRQHILIFRPAR